MVDAWNPLQALLAPLAPWTCEPDDPDVGYLLRVSSENGDTRPAGIGGVVGAGFGMRAVARELLDLVPVAGWAVKGAIAYTGTKAVGEAAVRYFAARG